MVFKFVIAALCATVGAFNPGLTLSTDFSMYNHAKDVYFDTVKDLVNNLTIPNLPIPGGYLNGNTFHYDEKKSDFKLEAGNNSIKFYADNLSGSFHSNDFRLKQLIFIATGNVDAKIHKMSVDFELEYTTQKLSSGKYVPAFKTLSSNVNLSKGDIDITIHGNIWSDLANLLKGLFMGVVKDQINKAITEQLAPGINSAIASQHGESVIFQDLALDWTVDHAPTMDTATQTFELGIKGLFFPNKTGEFTPVATAPVMPFKNTAEHGKIQVFVSDYLLDSLTSSVFKATNLTEGIKYVVPHTIVPVGHPLELNTNSLDLLFPGMVAKYGKDRNVDIQIDIKALNNFNAKTNSMSLDADLGLQFLVEKANGVNETAIDLTFEKLNLGFTTALEGMNIKPNVTSVTMKDIKVASSTIGTVNVALLQALVNEGLYDAKVPLNTLLANQTITIPKNVSGIFEILEPALKFHEGFIELGFTPNFLAQKTVEKTPYVAPVYDYSMFKTSMQITAEGKVIIIENENY